MGVDALSGAVLADAAEPGHTSPRWLGDLPEPAMSRLQAVAFDIIGTVFPLAPLQSRLDAMGLSRLALDFVYAAALRDSFALACANRYTPFKAAFAGALDEVLAIEGREATQGEKDALLDGLAALDAAPDARAAFQSLRGAGVRIVALSNGAAASTGKLLHRAGLADLVDEVLSVETVELSKPRSETYLYAARAMALAPSSMALVATHPWDVAGAIAADLKGGYVARGRPYPYFFAKPDVTGEDLVTVARGLAAA